MAVALHQQLPKNLRALASHLVGDLKNAQVYLVGGAVRDLLLGRATKDYDLVVRGVALSELEQWLSDHGQVSLVGKTFGVYKWQPAGWVGEVVDVALPRTEHVAEGSGAYRDFAVQSNPKLPIEDDLARRDFTINALALNLTSGELIDPEGGQADLRRKVIRTVGKAEERFAEDLSRTFRALRFACQLGFTIEPTAWQTVCALAQRAANGQQGKVWLVPREVVARELLKSLVANPVRAIELFDASGALSELLPEVAAMKACPQAPEFHSEGDVFQHTKLALAAFGTPPWKRFFGETKPSLNVVLATLLHDIGKPLTIKTPEQHGTNRIRTDGHDEAGAKLIPELCSRLALTSYTDPEAGQIDAEVVRWLVKYHLVIFNGPTETLRPSTIYRYFLKDPILGVSLQQLIFADSYGTKPQGGQDLTLTLHQFRPRIIEVEQKLQQGKLKLLMSGDDIMKAFNLKPGPKVGKLIKTLEEAQLEGQVATRAQAKAYLKEKL